MEKLLKTDFKVKINRILENWNLKGSLEDLIERRRKVAKKMALVTIAPEPLEREEEKLIYLIPEDKVTIFSQELLWLENQRSPRSKKIKHLAIEFINQEKKFPLDSSELSEITINFLLPEGGKEISLALEEGEEKRVSLISAIRGMGMLLWKKI